MYFARRCAVLTLSLFSAVSVFSQSAGRVGASVTQTIVVRSGSPAIVATSGTPVGWGDSLQTDKRGRVRVALDDGSILTLGSESKLQVVKHDATSQQTSLNLTYGRIRAQVAAITRNGGSFELRTPTAVAGVVGTDFGADASQSGETKFVCLSGITRIYTPDKSSYVDCGPGMTLTTRGVGALPTPSPATPEQTERWKHITEPGDPQFADGQASGGSSSQSAAATPVTYKGLDIGGSLRVRPQFWYWYDTPGRDDTYRFVESVLKVNIGQKRARWDWQIEAEAPGLWQLPENAVAPGRQGQLGLGGTYFAGVGNRQNSINIFPSKAFIRIKDLGGAGNSLQIGRFAFIDGTEVIPKDKTLADLKAMRIAHRLIGDFGFSVTGRSEDGFRFSSKIGRADMTVVAARPTRGVYQTDGLGELDVMWQYGALTVPVGSEKSAGELRLFGIGYHDMRGVMKTDNRPAAFRLGPDQGQNIDIATAGLHYIHMVETKAGTIDFLLWAAAQRGSWGLQDHRAGAATFEMGWQPKIDSVKPWFRGGYFLSSGDSNPNDNRHETFFAILPTPRIYARFPFFNEMNNTDAFAQLLLRPGKVMTLRTDAHWLWLTTGNDLWYNGGGAFQPRTFGYTGRSVLGAGVRDLGTLWDVSADFNINKNLTFGTYFGHVWGGGVQRIIYPAGDQNSNFGYLELNLRF